MSNNPPFAAIETARLTLRWPRAEDSAALAALMTPGISRWLAAWPFPLTEEFLNARLAHAATRAAVRAAMPVVVVRRADANVLGWIGLTCDGEDERMAMLGFWLGEAFYRQGYMREAVVAGVAAAFDFLDVDTIEAGAQLDNVAAFAVMRGCGMTPIGERLVYTETRGREEMCMFYAVSRTPR